MPSDSTFPRFQYFQEYFHCHSGHMTNFSTEDHLPTPRYGPYLTHAHTHIYSVFSLTWPASMQIYWNKRKRLHKKRVQLPHDWSGTQTWPPFHCFGTLWQIWPPWRHVKIGLMNEQSRVSGRRASELKWVLTECYSHCSHPDHPCTPLCFWMMKKAGKRKNLLHFSQTCEFWSSKANWRMRFWVM